MEEQTPVVRCKVQCGSAYPAIQDGAKYAESVSLYAVYGQDGSANAEWSTATPSAQFQLFISNPAAWGKLEPGKEYFVDFTPAEAAS